MEHNQREAVARAIFSVMWAHHIEEYKITFERIPVEIHEAVAMVIAGTWYDAELNLVNLYDMADAALAAMQPEWVPIADIPDDIGVHLRGMWCESSISDNTYWEQHIGYVDDETWEFVTPDGDYIGWNMGDYTHYAVIPTPPREEK